MTDYFSEVIDWIKENKPSKKDLAKYKLVLCKKHKRKKIPTDIEIFLRASPKDADKIRSYVETKPVRTGSGVAIVATMTKPFNCPHGSCTFCPGGLKSHFGDTPKSYTGKEPSTMRGKRNNYDAYRIVFNRLEQYAVIGQNADKVDQIIMGGTFCAFPKFYQQEFVYNSFKAYNDFSKIFYDKEGNFKLNEFKDFFELPGDINDSQRALRLKEKILELKEENKTSLEEQHEYNEKNSFVKCIGLTVETKPDWGFKEHGLKCLELGATRIELGIQTVYDDILQRVNRGHTIEDSKKSIADLRDLGFKLNFHMMPGLPDKNGEVIEREKDIASIKEIFTNPDFMPDMLKIYPCMVMPGTQLLEDYEKGIFTPLTTKEAADRIVEGFKYIPHWCRVMRVQRDIPTYATTSGVDRTNLRQYVDILAKERGVKLNDIRAREVRGEKISSKPKIKVTSFEASNGQEFFISAEADDKLIGFVRLRIPPRSLHEAITKTSALIRELHVYGSAVSIGDVDEEKSQHKGIGKQLMSKAEEIAKENQRDKMVVISGVGVRGYYRKLGYEKEGPYMTKKL
jgi:elongator complex protein 3